MVSNSYRPIDDPMPWEGGSGSADLKTPSAVPRLSGRTSKPADELLAEVSGPADSTISLGEAADLDLRDRTLPRMPPALD